VAASKDGEHEQLYEFVGQDQYHSAIHRRFVRPTGPTFSSVPFVPERLRPFYLATPPDIEACNADAECEVMSITLRRLSRLPNRARQFPPEAMERFPSALIADADSYIASFLYRPEAPPPKNLGRSAAQRGASRPTPQESPQVRLSNPFSIPYGKLPSVLPYSSRAWAAAGYLYLHIVLEPQLRSGGSYDDSPVAMDAYLLHWLISILCEDLSKSEDSMEIGAVSYELWLWKAIVGAYALEKGGWERVGNDPEGCAAWTAAMLQEDVNNVLSGSAPAQQSSPGEAGTNQPELQRWFGHKIRSWSQSSKVVVWSVARKALSRIAWPSNFEDDACVEQLWEDALAAEADTA
jgi:hypothetical protein